MTWQPLMLSLSFLLQTKSPSFCNLFLIDWHPGCSLFPHRFLSIPLFVSSSLHMWCPESHTKFKICSDHQRVRWRCFFPSLGTFSSFNATVFWCVFFFSFIEVWLIDQQKRYKQCADKKADTPSTAQTSLTFTAMVFQVPSYLAGQTCISFYCQIKSMVKVSVHCFIEIKTCYIF